MSRGCSEESFHFGKECRLAAKAWRAQVLLAAEDERIAKNPQLAAEIREQEEQSIVTAEQQRAYQAEQNHLQQEQLRAEQERRATVTKQEKLAAAEQARLAAVAEQERLAAAEQERLAAAAEQGRLAAAEQERLAAVAEQGRLDAVARDACRTLAAIVKDTADHPLAVATLNKGRSHSDELTTRASSVVAANLQLSKGSSTGPHSRGSFTGLHNRGSVKGLHSKVSFTCSHTKGSLTDLYR